MKNAKNEKLHINPQVVCILLLSLLLIACVVCIGVLGANMTSPSGQPSTEATVKPADNNTESVPSGGVQGAEVKVQKLVLSQTSAAVTAANGSVSKTLTAYVYPEDAKNKAVDWTIEWLDTEETTDISDYLTLVPDSDGSATAQLTCLQAFDGEAERSSTPAACCSSAILPR